MPQKSGRARVRQPSAPHARHQAAVATTGRKPAAKKAAGGKKTKKTTAKAKAKPKAKAAKPKDAKDDPNARFKKGLLGALRVSSG